MTGLLLVSHSRRLAEGLAELVHAMAREVPAVALGGEEGNAGVSAEEVLAGWRTLALRSDEVVALADLGSSLLNLENAREMAGADRPCPLEIADAPFVEGAVAAAMIAVTGGASREAREAAEAAWAERKRG